MYRSDNGQINGHSVWDENTVSDVTQIIDEETLKQIENDRHFSIY